MRAFVLLTLLMLIKEIYFSSVRLDVCIEVLFLHSMLTIVARLYISLSRFFLVVKLYTLHLILRSIPILFRICHVLCQLVDPFRLIGLIRDLMIFFYLL